MCDGILILFDNFLTGTTSGDVGTLSGPLTDSYLARDIILKHPNTAHC